MFELSAVWRCWHVPRASLFAASSFCCCGHFLLLLQKGSMSVAEACSSLRCFAAASADVDRMHLAALMQHVLRDAGQVNEYDAACVLYSIRK